MSFIRVLMIGLPVGDDLKTCVSKISNFRDVLRSRLADSRIADDWTPLLPLDYRRRVKNSSTLARAHGLHHPDRLCVYLHY